MTEESKGAITSDEVETDNREFATVKADQTCEAALVPRENALHQLNSWQVTVEKGAVYNPQEEVGIHAKTVDCKYGTQINGTVFGSDTVSIEYGGAAHSGDGDETIGTRIFGSVISEGRTEFVTPEAKMDDWDERPIRVYGDVMGEHVTFEEPTIVYGSVIANETFRTNAPTVVLGDVRSDGIVETSDLFAFSITATSNILLGENVAVVNPVIRSEAGRIVITDSVGIFTPGIFEQIRQNNDIEAIGPWVLDVGAVWESSLLPVDITDSGDGMVASRTWRTVEEPKAEDYERIREMFEELIRATRKNEPDIEESRHTGVGSLGNIVAGDGRSDEGDMTPGSQEEPLKDTGITQDESETTIDQSTETHDESTTDVDQNTTGEERTVTRSDADNGGDSETDANKSDN
jgi:hypothetical protein